MRSGAFCARPPPPDSVHRLYSQPSSIRTAGSGHAHSPQEAVTQIRRPARGAQSVQPRGVPLVGHSSAGDSDAIGLPMPLSARRRIFGPPVPPSLHSPVVLAGCRSL